MYFSGRAAEFFRDSDLYGVMLSYKSTGGQQRALDNGCLWMLDNGAFSGNFDEPRWLGQMGRLLTHSEQCCGVVAPDAVILDRAGKFEKGDWYGTLQRLERYSPIIRGFGYPVAYALQDDHPLEEMPWWLFDVLFVAGTTEYKESVQVEQIAKEAIRFGKRVHIGRVSSAKRISLTWWADSWDGTTFKWDEDDKHRIISGAISKIRANCNQWRLI